MRRSPELTRTTGRVAIIDYEAGNLRSIGKALEAVGAQVRLLEAPDDRAEFSAIILPGVGAFGAAMRRLSAAGFPEWLRLQVSAGRPLIGVCLGMQLLFERSEENADVPGLALLPGTVRRLPRGLKVPHVGWNGLTVLRPAALLENVADGAYVYFVHSYVVHPAEERTVIAVTRYGEEFPAIMQRDQVVGLQFHPEKSGAVGRLLLRNLVRWIATRAGAEVR